jgi:predicted RNase H-like nuclease
MLDGLGPAGGGAEDQLWIGVDGARAGWAVAVVDGLGRAQLRLMAEFADIFERWPGATRIWVDMPIGLPSGQARRTCDEMARRALRGGRAASVFSPPCREALDADDHAEASRINREVTGRGLSIQAWNISHRIQELDQVLREQPAWSSRVLESHPEVVFGLLASFTPGWPATSDRGGLPLLPPKRSDEGRTQRIELLEHHFAGCGRLIDQVDVPRRSVGYDDWVDALGLAVAQYASRGRTVRWPDPVEHDAHDLGMALAVPVP